MRRCLLLPCLLLLALVAPATAGAQVASDTPPTVSTRAASPVGAMTATVRAGIDPNGQPVSYRFEYGTTTSYGLTTADRPAGLGDTTVSVSETLEGLTEDTVYHYRVIAWPDSDPTAIVRGADRTFHTIGPPEATSNNARDPRPDGATLDGKVDPNRAATTTWFEWGPTRDYGNQTPPVAAGSDSVRREFSAAIGGLTPNTTYHYRIVAQNAAGTSRGGDRSFRTLRAPSAITLNPAPTVVGYGRSAVVSGQVQGVGIGGIRLTLESTPFPFSSPFGAPRSTVTAGSDGSFRIATLPLQVATRLRVVTGTTPAVLSPEVVITPSLLVRTSSSLVSARRSVVAGTVKPSVTGAKVTVQRKAGTRWVFAKRTRTKRLGGGRVGFSATVSRVARARRYRVVIKPRTGAYAKTTTRSLKVPARPRRH